MLKIEYAQVSRKIPNEAKFVQLFGAPVIHTMNRDIVIDAFTYIGINKKKGEI